MVSFDLKRCLQSGEQMIYILLAIYQGVEMLNYESEEEKKYTREWIFFYTFLYFCHIIPESSTLTVPHSTTSQTFITLVIYWGQHQFSENDNKIFWYMALVMDALSLLLHFLAEPINTF